MDVPIYIKTNAAKAFKKASGTISDIDPPASAPNKLVKIRAVDDPRKTAKGLSVDPLKANVASWVLSPSSAINTVVNTVINRVNSIYLFIREMKPWIDWNPSQIPRPIIMYPEIRLKLTLGNVLESHFPKITTTSVEHINANADPTKTMMGRPDWAESNNVAICVLSPNSAMNKLINVERKILINPLEVFPVFTSLLFSEFTGKLAIIN